MIKPEAIRLAKRVSAIVAAVVAVGGLSVAAASAVVRADDAHRRLLSVESSERRLEQDLSRLEGKVDALLFYFRVPAPKETP